MIFYVSKKKLIMFLYRIKNIIYKAVCGSTKQTSKVDGIARLKWISLCFSDH